MIVFLLTACGDRSTTDTSVEVGETETSTTVSPPSTRPVTFEEFGVNNNERSLGLFLDACNVEFGDVDVEETDEVITVAVTEVFTPPTTNQLGESEEAPDCQDVLNVELETPLEDREVVDAATGEVANIIR